MSNNDVKNPNPRIRPRQVLLVGLGGVGSRTVDKVLSIMPEDYKKYTRAIAIDTDIGDLGNEISNIPDSNRIALGSNPDTKQSITIGDYIKNHPATTEWFVKGDKLDTIAKRSTTQGAKQIRMVSRIALAATNDFCGMKSTLEQVIRQFNADDGSFGSSGLLVMIVCSIAGGTGAGTVLQFPLYLEQAISGIFADEDVQFDCSMLLPDMFRRVQSEENYKAGKANAYAVIRELMSINARKLKRGDIIANSDLEVKGENISPFGRVLFFDSTSMAGDTLDGDLDHVYIPKVASALNEYLFGSVNGKITSALDNTLRRVYDSGGQAIFGSVGTSRLCFPRATYTQYVTANWVSKAIAKQWLEIDQQAEKLYKDEYKRAVDNDTERPNKDARLRELYCQLVDEKNDAFYREIRARFKVANSEDSEAIGIVNDEVENLVDLFWCNCENYLRDKKENNDEYSSASSMFSNRLKSKGVEISRLVELLKDYEKAARKLSRVGTIYAKQVICPPEAENGVLYASKTDESTLFGFIKAHKLHPIMIRYFLYKLYDLLKELAVHSGQSVDYDKIGKYKKFNRESREVLDKEGASVDSNILTDIYANFAETALKDLDIYIEEYEDMFKRLDVVVDRFEKKKKICINQLPDINKESGTILAGGTLSMMYTWRKVEEEISAGDDVYTIDDELDEKIHEIVYKAFIKQVVDLSNVKQLLANGKKLKVRTRYEDIMTTELQSYYAKKINTNYGHCFPENVIEASLLQCGLENAFKRDSSGVDASVGFDHAMFIERNPIPYNITTPEAGFVTDAAYFENLLSSLIGKGKPFCGRVESNGESASSYINRLMAINRSMLRTKEDTLHINEDGTSSTVYIEDEIIDGVSSSRIGNFNINTKFLDSGISSDEIIAVTTLSGLEPKAFVSFLPPDDNEFSPTKEQSYYTAYSDFLDSLAISKNEITPHLHWNWHVAGMLSDITQDHTNTYSKQAAEAFLYGFIFDLITVSNDAMVNIGKIGESIFTKALEGDTIREFALLSPEVHASVDAMSGEEKRNTMNTLFVKIFELLSTSAPIRNTIITYCENKMREFKETNSPQFVGNCLQTESVDEVRYACILDIIIGYYKGTRHLSVAEVVRADKNVEEMFRFLLSKTFEVAKYVAFKDNSDAVDIYNKFVEMYYQVAEGDDEVAESSTTGKADISTIADDNNKSQNITDWLSQITGTMAQRPKNPFAPGSANRYSIDSALSLGKNFLAENN